MDPHSEQGWLGRNHEAIYDLLVNRVECGPFDGGCAIFARACQLRYWGEVGVLVRSDGRADHAVLRAGNLFIDGDGPATSAADIISRFNANEGARALGYRPIRDGDLPCAPRNEGLSVEIAKLLPEVLPIVPSIS